MEREDAVEAREVPDPDVRFLVLSAGVPGGAGLLLGQGICDVVSREVPGLILLADPAPGWREAASQVGSGVADLGLVRQDVAYEAVTGQGAFLDDRQPLRAVFSVYSMVIHILVLAESPVKAIKDLSGRAIGVEEGVGEVAAKAILEAAGLGALVTTVVLQSEDDASSALAEGAVEAVFHSSPYPSEWVKNVCSYQSIRLVPLEDGLVNPVKASWPFFTVRTIPGRTYPKVSGDVKALALPVLLVCSEDLEPATVYSIAGAVFQDTSLEDLEAFHPLARQISPESRADTCLPLHPGAGQFFREDGGAS
jgi:TRAP transporter TAXI family solute receptor